MDLSLIISTRNRCQQLGRCLEAMHQLKTERHWELIIMDNGSTDETAAVVRGFIAASSLTTAYVFEARPGKSTALNTALGIARGQILAFTDDDCYPAQDFLDCVWSAFKDPAVGYITGRILLHDPSDYPIAINESTAPLCFPAGSFLVAGSVFGANMAFRREVLHGIGGFDPLLGPGAMFVAAEDTEAAARASATGWKGLYRPEVVVRHHHGRKASAARRMWKSYGIGIGAYYMKLLLRNRQFRWVPKMISGQFGSSRRMLLWEPVGAAGYAGFLAVQTLRNWFRPT
jgi:glycosyltransferase involved in cell wall biosynthesis